MVFIDEFFLWRHNFQRPYREPLTINTWLQKLYVGCSGWSYNGWLGHFYPPNLDHREYLRYYSQVFDFVEIDSLRV